MKTDSRLDLFLNQLDQQELLTDLELCDIADECVALRESDQVSEPRLFIRGVELADKAGDSEIYYVDSYEVRYYFIGTVDKIIERIKEHL